VKWRRGFQHPIGVRQAPITPASRPPRQIEHFYSRSLPPVLFQLDRPLRSDSAKSNVP
jgi:hypothetical protein